MSYREPAAIELYTPSKTAIQVCKDNIAVLHKKKYDKFINQIKRASERGKRMVDIGLSDQDAKDCGFKPRVHYDLPAPSAMEGFNPKDILWLTLLKEQGFEISFYYTSERLCYQQRIIIRF